MTHEDDQCLKLGKMVLRMIRDLAITAGRETGYARRGVTFPGGEVQLLLVNDPKLADLMEAVADKNHAVESVTPPSQRN